MEIIITEEWLESHRADEEEIKYICKEGLIGLSASDFTKKIINLNKIDHKKWFYYANWLITSVMSQKSRVQYAVFAADEVLPIFERRFSADVNPRKAVEAAKKYIIYPTKENAASANDAGHMALGSSAFAKHKYTDNETSPPVYFDAENTALAAAYAAYAAFAAPAVFFEAAENTALAAAYAAFAAPADAKNAELSAIRAAFHAARAASLFTYTADYNSGADDAAIVAFEDMFKKILSYGLTLIEK